MDWGRSFAQAARIRAREPRCKRILINRNFHDVCGSYYGLTPNHSNRVFHANPYCTFFNHGKAPTSSSFQAKQIRGSPGRLVVYFGPKITPKWSDLFEKWRGGVSKIRKPYFLFYFRLILSLKVSLAKFQLVWTSDEGFTLRGTALAKNSAFGRCQDRI